MPSALAQHFVYCNMRCPVCLEDSDQPLVVKRSDIPALVGRALCKQVSVMNEEDEDEEETTVLETFIVYEIDIETIRDSLQSRST